MAKVNWNTLYSTEQELIEDMLKARSDIKKYPYHTIVKGYEYIEGFKRYYQKNGRLTDKQMTQLKRLANEVYYNVNLLKINAQKGE